jgi:hypothetical protein
MLKCRRQNRGSKYASPQTVFRNEPENSADVAPRSLSFTLGHAGFA